MVVMAVGQYRTARALVQWLFAGVLGVPAARPGVDDGVVVAGVAHRSRRGVERRPSGHVARFVEGAPGPVVGTSYPTHAVGIVIIHFGGFFIHNLLEQIQI